MKEYIAQLKNTRLFAGMSETEIEAIFRCLSVKKKSYRKGECIFRRGECIDSVAVLVKGSVHIQKEDYWGNLSILGEISEGEIFGEVYACLGNAKLLNHAVAVKDSTVLFLKVSQILTTCPSACPFHSRLIQNLLSVMAFKNQTLAQKLEYMSQRTIREKLLSYLSVQSLRAGSAYFDIPYNRQQLADYLAVDRSAMSKELCKMRDEGILEFRKNHFVLH